MAAKLQFQQLGESMCVGNRRPLK